MSTATLTPIASVAGSEIPGLSMLFNVPRTDSSAQAIFRTLSVLCGRFLELYVIGPLKLILVLLYGDAHQLTARANTGFLKQALEDRFDVALGNLQAPGDFLIG